MLRCAKCGRVIPAFEVKYRIEVNGERVDLCPDDYRAIKEGQSKKA